MPKENYSPENTDPLPWNIFLQLQITCTGASNSWYTWPHFWGEALYKDPERPIHSERVWRKCHV